MIYRMLRIGRDGHLDKSGAYIYHALYENTDSVDWIIFFNNEVVCSRNQMCTAEIYCKIFVACTYICTCIFYKSWFLSLQMLPLISRSIIMMILLIYIP